MVNRETSSPPHCRILFFIQLLVNFDSGAIPSVLEILKNDYDLSPLQLGILGCVPYAGITAASAPAGVLLQSFSQKRVLITALVVNGFCCGFLAFAENIAGKGNNPYVILVVARFVIGVLPSGIPFQGRPDFDASIRSSSHVCG